MKLSNTWYALILIASALLLRVAGPSANALQNEKDNQTHDDHPQEQSEPAQVQPPVLVPSPAYYAAILGELRTIIREELANDKQKHADRNDWDTPAFWVSVALAIVGAAYTIIAYRQLNAISVQSVIAAEMARAANKSADVAERQLSRTERPWISFEATKILGTKYIVDRIKRLHPTLQERPDSLTVEIIQISVQYRFNNSGRTPARLVGGDVQLICADPKSLPIEPFYRFIPTPASLLPPGNSAVNSLTVRIFPHTCVRLVRRVDSLILFGFVQYRDVIGEDYGPLHESRFRVECDFPGYDPAGGKFTLAGPFYFAFAGPDSYNRYT